MEDVHSQKDAANSTNDAAQSHESSRAPGSSIKAVFEQASPPTNSSIAEERTDTPERASAAVSEEPKEAAETSTSSDSDADRKSSSPSSASPQDKIWDRLRAAQSSLPSFDGLTSSSSLSTLLATASTRGRDIATTLRSKLSSLSAQYNTYSGYSAIEDLKSRITTLESSLDSARTLASEAKKAYLLSVQERSSSQRETNDLLSRKNSWSESDLSRYTELLRKEHALTRSEANAEQNLERTEAEVQLAFDELMKAVMVRYHEEQIWSDRMRGWSTYGSLVVAGLNAFLFILAILLVEPYKRKRLAQTFEERLVSAEEQSRGLILKSVEEFKQSLEDALAQQSGAAVGIAEEDERETKESRKSEEVVTPPQPTLVEVEEQLPPTLEAGLATAAEEGARRKREDEERLVFASTVGVVVGAALSLLISACWS